MVMPWVLAEAGSETRSLSITLARGCFQGYPTTRLTQTSAFIRIRAFAWGPALRHGRLDMTCGGGTTSVNLRSPIDGRRIEGQSPRAHLHYSAWFPLPSPVGLPRVLSLSPADAVHVLSLYGFRAHISGTGPEIVAQVPGWGLFGPHRQSPVHYTGVTKLVAGSRIEIPTQPEVPLGAPSGTLAGAIKFEGGPAAALTKRRARPPLSKIAGVGPCSLALPCEDLFNTHGRLLAIFGVPIHRPFRLHLATGRYLLFADDSCAPTRADVHTGSVAWVTVGVGCDVP